jgi:hypothetical protein
MSAGDYSAIKSCLDVTDKHIADALAAARTLSEPSPREKTLGLLKHMAGIARPGTGVPRMLLLLAKMAKRDWLDGELMVKLLGDSELTVIELLIDDGASVERMLGPLRIDVPIKEFAVAVERNLAMLAPLEVTERDGRRLFLKGTRDHRSLARKASISAFAVDLRRGFSIPDVARNKPAKPREEAQTGSYDKATAVLEMPAELRAPAAAKPVKAPAATPAAPAKASVEPPKQGPPPLPGGRKPPPPLPVRKK